MFNGKMSVVKRIFTLVFILALILCTGCDPDPTLIIPDSDDTLPTVKLWMRFGDQNYIVDEEREVDEIFVEGVPTVRFFATATDKDGGIKNVKIHVYLYIDGEYGKTIDHMIYETENPDYAIPGEVGRKSRNVSMQITEDEWRNNIAITLNAPIVYGSCHAEGVNFQDNTVKTTNIKIVMLELSPY